MSIADPTCLVTGDVDPSALPRDLGWNFTGDRAASHLVVLAFVPCAAAASLRHSSSKALMVAPPVGTLSAERAAALAAGADDVLPEDCGSAELIARLDALVRRRGGGASPIRCGDLSIDPLRRSASRGGSDITLLPREYALLRHLADEAGRAVSRMDLLRHVWRLSFDPCTNVVEVHISRLRAKLDRGFPQPLLHTVRGRGYALAEMPPLD